MLALFRVGIFWLEDKPKSSLGVHEFKMKLRLKNHVHIRRLIVIVPTTKAFPACTLQVLASAPRSMQRWDIHPFFWKGRDECSDPNLNENWKKSHKNWNIGKLFCQFTLFVYSHASKSYGSGVYLSRPMPLTLIYQVCICL